MSVTELFDAYQRACVASGVRLQSQHRPSVSDADWAVYCAQTSFDVHDVPASVIEWYRIADVARMLPVGNYWLSQLDSPTIWDRLDDGFLESHPCEQSVQILYGDRGDITVSTREQDKGAVWLQDWAMRIDGLAWRSIEHMLENLTALLEAGNLKPTNPDTNLDLACHDDATIPIPAIYDQTFAGGLWAGGTLESGPANRPMPAAGITDLPENISVLPLLELLRERERDVFVSRILSDEPATLEDLSVKHGVTTDRIRQAQRHADNQIRVAFGLESNERLRRHIFHIREQLGAAFPPSLLDDILPSDGTPDAETDRSLKLWLAGPFTSMPSGGGG